MHLARLIEDAAERVAAAEAVQKQTKCSAETAIAAVNACALEVRIQSVTSELLDITSSLRDLDVELELLKKSLRLDLDALGVAINRERF
jgi:hypothetical protein